MNLNLSESRRIGILLKVLNTDDLLIAFFTEKLKWTIITKVKTLMPLGVRVA